MPIKQWDRTAATGEGTGSINTASNVNAEGVGVFKQKTADNLEFKGISSANAAITVTDDAVNSEVSLDFIPANVDITALAGQLDLEGAQVTGELQGANFPGLTGLVTTDPNTFTTEIADGALSGVLLTDNTVDLTKIEQAPTATIVGNSSGITGALEYLALKGALSVVAGFLKSRNSFSFSYVFSTNTTMSDPTDTFIKFNAGTINGTTQIAISPETAEGRSIANLLAAATGGRIGIMANDISSTSFALADITDVDDNGTGDFYTFTVTPINNLGVLPSNNQELIVFIWPASSSSSSFGSQDVLDMRVLRRNLDNQILDELGNVMSGSPVVADYAALLALDAAAFDGFAINIQSNFNNAFFAPNGTAFGPVNGLYVQERAAKAGKWFIGGNNVTWTAANNGSGKVRLTSSGVHGLTTSPAVGANLYQTGSATGWTANTAHEIATIVDTTHIDLTTNYTASMGVPVFRYASSTVANSEITHKEIVLPELRDTTEAEVSYEYELFGTVNASDAKRFLFYLNSTNLNNHNSTAANKHYLMRHGFSNQNDAAIQKGLAGENSTGLAPSTLIPLTAAVDTSVSGAIIKLATMIETVNVAIRLNAVRCIIRG